MADIDLARVKRNVSKMVGMDAPEADIDAYIAEEGTTIDAVKAFRLDAPAAPAGIPADDPRREFIRAAKERVATGAPRPDVELTDAEKAVPTAPQDRYDPGALGASTMAGGDALMFGWGDEIQSVLTSPIEMGIGAYTGEDDGKSIGQRITDGYNRGLRKREDLMAYARGQHPLASGIGTVAGTLYGASGLTKAGLSLTSKAAQSGAGLTKLTAASAVDGAAMGALTGAGSGSGTEGRINGAVEGGLAGLALGAAVPLAVTGVTAAAKPFIAPIAARIAPERYTNQALSSVLRRAGMKPDEVAKQLEEAALDGQGVFTVADALGNSGQRMLSTVTRTPNDARQAAVEQLLSRQAGQGRRLQTALVEGFGAPQTKKQTEAALTALRQSEAGVNYGAARASSGTVNPTSAIAKADDFLGTSGSLPATDIAPDSVAGIVRRAKSLLTDGENVVTDFATAFRAKVELDDLIEKGTSTIKAQLIPIRNELDTALEKASPTYSKARDTYRSQSQNIEAADVGRDAAMRGRVEDTIPRFQGLTRPEQQASFRAGYVDPYIETIQTTPGPMSNKARPLISDATADEFPTFALPGKGGQLGNRIAREQRMFETTNQALGGSRTADNLADMEDMANFDPAMISRLLRGDVTGAVIGAVTQAFNATKGLPPRVIEQVGKALMTTDPVAARRLLSVATSKALSNEGRKRAAVTILRSVAVTAAGRSSAP